MAYKSPRDPFMDELDFGGVTFNPLGGGESDPYQGPGGYNDFTSNESRAVEPAIPVAGSANTGPSPYNPGAGSFRDWWTGIQGQNNSQDWLMSMESLLQQSGSKITPANSMGERSKIWDPQGQDWVRVIGAGEGHPVWMGQGWGVNGPSAGGGGAPAPAPSAYQRDPQVTDAIRKLLERGFQPVTEDSVRDRYQPASVAMQRGAGRAKDAAAERAAFQGTSVGGAGGALDAEHNKIGMDVAEREGVLMSGLIGDDLKAQREDIYAALQAAQGEERNQLSMQLAQIDAELQRYGIDTRDRQFYDEMGYNIGRDEYLFNQEFGRNQEDR